MGSNAAGLYWTRGQAAPSLLYLLSVVELYPVNYCYLHADCEEDRRFMATDQSELQRLRWC